MRIKIDSMGSLFLGSDQSSGTQVESFGFSNLLHLHMRSIGLQDNLVKIHASSRGMRVIHAFVFCL